MGDQFIFTWVFFGFSGVFSGGVYGSYQIFVLSFLFRQLVVSM